MQSQFAFRVFSIACVFLFISGCGPSEFAVQSAKDEAHIRGERELATLQNGASLVPAWYARGLYVETFTSTEGSWLNGYRALGYYWFGSKYLIIALVVWIVFVVVAWKVMVEKTDGDDIAYGLSVIGALIPFAQWLVLWVITAVFGMAVAAWPGWILCLSVMLGIVEATCLFCFVVALKISIEREAAEKRQRKAEKRIAKKAEARRARDAAEAEAKRLRTAAKAEAKRARDAEKAEAERARAAEQAAVEHRNQKLSKGN